MKVGQLLSSNKFLYMKKIYVVGASGLIGNTLYKKLLKKKLDVIGTYSKNKQENLIHLDITESNFKILENINIDDVIILMSAYSNPNWISQNKEQAKLLNYDNTKRLIDFLSPKNPKFIFMSSVEIFDGEKGNYQENDIANPLNYYGVLKVKIEEYLLNNYRNYCIVRTGWNVGLNEKSRCVVELTYETLLKPNAKMAKDNFFSLASVEDTAEVISKIIEEDSIKIIHICSDKIINRVELANMILKHSKHSKRMNYNECFFKDIPYSEPRGRINDLNNNLSKKYFNMNYKDTNQIILDKILYIDKKINE